MQPWTHTAALWRIVAAVTAADRQQRTRAVCIPPDPQYLSTFIRNINGAIVDIRYDIVDYVC